MKLQRSVAVLCTLALLATMALAQQPASRAPQATTAKRALTHQDYDSWRSIVAQQVSRDGKFVAYAYMPEDGDGEIVVRNIATGVDWRAPRGYRPPVPPPDESIPNAAELIAEQARLLRPVFTTDSRFLVFGTEPLKAEVAKAKKEKRKPEEMPKNGLSIMELATGTVTRVERVKTFRVPEDGSGFIAYLSEPVASTTNPPSSGRAKKKEYGSELTLRNLTTGAERKFADVLDFTISKDAKLLVFATSSHDEATNGVYAVTTANADGPPTTLLTGKGKYQKLTWDEDNTQLAFISDKEDSASKQPKFRVYHWNFKDPQATEIVSTNSPGFPKDMVISDRANLSFSLDGSHLFLGSAPPPDPEKSPDEEVPADEKVLVDLWFWKDDYVQPIQKVRTEQDRNRSFRAVYDLAAKKFVQLADESMENVTPSNDGRYAIGADNRKYRIIADYDPGLYDYYLVNTADGSRKPLATKQRGAYSLSPNAKYAIYFDGKDWNSYSIADGTVVNLTKDLKVNFYNEDNDVPATPGSYGLAGWTKDDHDVLLYDRYDLWQIAPDGSRAKDVTDGVGRKEKPALRYVRLDPKERSIDPDKPNVTQRGLLL